MCDLLNLRDLLKICLLFVFAIFSIIIVMILNTIEFSHHTINFLPPNEEVWSSLLILDLLRATNFVCCHNNHANFDWNNHEKFYLYEKFLLCFNAVLQLRVASVVFDQGLHACNIELDFLPVAHAYFLRHQLIAIFLIPANKCFCLATRGYMGTLRIWPTTLICKIMIIDAMEYFMLAISPIPSMYKICEKRTRHFEQNHGFPHDDFFPVFFNEDLDIISIWFKFIMVFCFQFVALQMFSNGHSNKWNSWSPLGFEQQPRIAPPQIAPPPVVPPPVVPPQLPLVVAGPLPWFALKQVDADVQDICPICWDAFDELHEHSNKPECPLGHTMVITNDVNGWDEWSCDGEWNCDEIGDWNCDEGGDSDTMRWRCASCDFDLCLLCEPQNNCVVQLNCNHCYHLNCLNDLRQASINPDIRESCPTCRAKYDAQNVEQVQIVWMVD